MNAPTEKKFRDPSLVDCGGGRRLEQLGGVLVDRPLPQAGLRCAFPAIWGEAGAVYRPRASHATVALHDGPGGLQGVDGARGHRGAIRLARSAGEWELKSDLPQPWCVELPLEAATLRLEVRPAPSGQIGIFLEQLAQWQWLQRVTLRGCVVLSLFAHSGAATLAMAAAGATVVHVDASKPAIALARRNAEASGLAAASIRWVCEDARTFISRQLRRGMHFDGAVLDPPSWGHGPKGQAFAIDRDLLPLLGDIGRLLGVGNGQARTGPVLLTCHSTGWHPSRLHDTLATVLPRGRIESGPLTCTDAAGRTLEMGSYARQCPIP